MRNNMLLDLIAGVLVGFILGTVFYYFPTSCLITGPFVGDELFLPSELHHQMLLMSAKFGGGAGIIIGGFTGLTTSKFLPRGYMSVSTSVRCFLVCVILAFIQHGHNLKDMTAWRIFVTGAWVFGLLLLAMPLGHVYSFIERIRE